MFLWWATNRRNLGLHFWPAEIKVLEFSLAQYQNSIGCLFRARTLFEEGTELQLTVTAVRDFWGETVRAVFRTVKVGCGCHMSCWMREAGIIVLVACVTSFLFILHLAALILGWGWWWWWWWELRAGPRYNVCESPANCLHATELYRHSQESSVPSWSIIRFRACVLSVDSLKGLRTKDLCFS